jgi:nucleoside 2-deoxyribosyltransferase
MAQYDLRKMATSLPCSRCAIDAQDSGAIMAQHFLAYSSRDTTHADTIRRAASNVSSPQVTYTPWATEDASASPVGKAVEAWIDDAEAVVADITFVNDNVTYEIGYAIGAQKDLRLIYNSSRPFKKQILSKLGCLTR